MSSRPASLHSEFPEIQGYIVRSRLKNKNKTNKINHRTNTQKQIVDMTVQTFSLNIWEVEKEGQVFRASLSYGRGNNKKPSKQANKIKIN